MDTSYIHIFHTLMHIALTKIASFELSVWFTLLSSSSVELLIDLK